MKIIYTGRVAVGPISPSVIHRALSLDHKTHTNMYLVMTPKDMMVWFTTFLRKYYI
jgi:hypothetical protein